MDSAKTFEEFKEILKNHEIKTFSKFNVYKNPKGFLDEKREISADMKLHWKDGLPYFHFGSRIYTCHQGRDKNLRQKQKYAEKKQEKAKTDHIFQKTYNLTQTTKKLDCPASITVTRVYTLPQFKMENPTNSKKRVISEKIRNKLRNNEDVEGEETFWFTLPSVDDHKNHVQGEISAITEPVDPAVRAKIKELVREGKRNALVISELLEIFVTTELKQNDRKRRRFFPDVPTIKGIIKEGKRDIRHSKIDMENTEKFLESYDKGDFFFRPFTKESVNDEKLGDDEENDEEGACNIKWKSISNNHFLFVYQNTDMRRLYRRYAGETVLLDATYRICKYAVPLYFLVVKTNINFQVVAVIMSQYETTASLCEALEIVKCWNADIYPKNAMVDFAAEEISALEKVFPGINVFICSFHREQAWNRWLSRSQNSSVPKDEALALLWNVANAPTEEKLQEALKMLKDSNFYESTPLKHYFEGTWEPEIRRWSLAYKPDNMLLNTNNGVERLNEELKYRFLDGYRNCHLSEIINVLINTFLPQRYDTYLRGNLRMSAKYMKYSVEIPSYLHERPKWFIEHMQEKLEKLHLDDEKSVEVIGEDLFLVSSQSGSKYTVKFNKNQHTCSCTCVEYRRTRLICKHCLIVGIKFKEYHISRIHQWLLSNPLFCCDKEFLNINHKEIDPEPMDVEPGCDDHDVMPQVKNEKTQGAEVYGELEKRGSKRRKIINECNSLMRNLGSILWMLPEDSLLELKKELSDLSHKMEKKVVQDDATGLPLEINEDQRNYNGMTMIDTKEVKTNEASKDATEGNKLKQYGKLQACAKKGFAKRVGMKATAMRQAYKQTVLKNEAENTNIIIDGYCGEMVTTSSSSISDDLTAFPVIESCSFINGKGVIKCNDTGKSLQEDSGNEIHSNMRNVTENQSNGIKKRKKLYSSELSNETIESECMPGAMLSDVIINFSQKKLKSHWNDPGLQDTLLGQNLSFSIKSSGLQILHINGNHWVTTQILSSSHVNIYDSLGLAPSPDLQRQIAAIICSKSKSVNLCIKPVQKQLPLSNDCGVLAIAFVVSLLMGRDPSILNYDSLHIRDHLKMCLKTGVFTSFPETTKRLLRVKEKTFVFSVYCTCRMPSFSDDMSSNKLRMAQCEQCKEWIHKHCGKIPEAVFTQSRYHYICNSCASSA